MSGGIGKVQKIVIGIIIVGILSNGMTMLMICLLYTSFTEFYHADSAV